MAVDQAKLDAFVGFDYHDRSIEWARKAATEAGVGDRCAFEVAPADAYPGEGYDLVATGEGLGSQVPEATWRDLPAKAGFGRVRRATETPFNRVFEARP
jgi:hypothetical protein